MVKRNLIGKRLKILMVVPQNLPHFYDNIMKRSFGCEVIFSPDDEDSIMQSVSGVDALIGCPRALFTESLLRKAGPNLKWVHNPGAGVEPFFTPYFVNSEIIFTNGKIIQGPECADHALALLLSLTRNIIRYANGESSATMPRPIELKGKKGVVFGGGGIGLNVAERLSAFGVETSIVDNELIPMLSFVKRQYYFEQAQDAFGDSDIVICCAPLTKKTFQFFNRQVVSNFKRGSYFVNVSRGKLVETDGLVYGLDNGILSGVGLDVTDPEPLPKDHVLRTYSNVAISNHVAGLSEFNRDRSKLLIARNIERFVAGDNLLNVVNKISEY